MARYGLIQFEEVQKVVIYLLSRALRSSISLHCKLFSLSECFNMYMFSLCYFIFFLNEQRIRAIFAHTAPRLLRDTLQSPPKTVNVEGYARDNMMWYIYVGCARALCGQKTTCATALTENSELIHPRNICHPHTKFTFMFTVHTYAAPMPPPPPPSPERTNRHHTHTHTEPHTSHYTLYIRYIRVCVEAAEEQTQSQPVLASAYINIQLRSTTLAKVRLARNTNTQDRGHPCIYIYYISSQLYTIRGL